MESCTNFALVVIVRKTLSMKCYKVTDQVTMEARTTTRSMDNSIKFSALDIPSMETKTTSGL
jgi:hypothetical protein